MASFPGPYVSADSAARYSLEDCRRAEDIFIQEKLLEFAIERSLLMGFEPDRHGGTVAAFDALTFPNCIERDTWRLPWRYWAAATISYNRSGESTKM